MQWKTMATMRTSLSFSSDSTLSTTCVCSLFAAAAIRKTVDCTYTHSLPPVIVAEFQYFVSFCVSQFFRQSLFVACLMGRRIQVSQTVRIEEWQVWREIQKYPTHHGGSSSSRIGLLARPSTNEKFVSLLLAIARRLHSTPCSKVMTMLSSRRKKNCTILITKVKQLERTQGVSASSSTV